MVAAVGDRVMPQRAGVGLSTRLLPDPQEIDTIALMTTRKSVALLYSKCSPLPASCPICSLPPETDATADSSSNRSTRAHWRVLEKIAKIFRAEYGKSQTFSADKDIKVPTRSRASTTRKKLCKKKGRRIVVQL
jgi:hypothetical protein